MKSNAPVVFALALLVGLLPAASHGAVGEHSQEFEVLVQADPDALARDGSLVCGNESAPALSGQYCCVLITSTGPVARSMGLRK